MKQKKFGKKVHNWHRPFGRSELRHRFLALRNDDAEYTKRGQIITHGGVPFETDDYWDIYNPRHEYTDDLYFDGEAYFEYNLNYMWQLCSAPVNTFAKQTSVLETFSIEIERPVEDHLKCNFSEQELFDYINRLEVERVNSKGLEALINKITDVATDQDREIITQYYEGDRRTELLGKYFMLFAPFWVRKPSTWQDNKDKDLLTHLFLFHDVPDFLFSAVLLDRMSPLKWICWLIILGQGGSLKRAAPLFDWDIKGRFSHYLQFIPDGLSATEACIFAKVRQLGGDENDFRRVLNCHELVIDPTEKPEDPEYLLFWQASVQWLVKHKNELEDEECSPILRWALHKHTEALRAARDERQPVKPFIWKGRSVCSTLEKVNEYHRNLSRPYLQYKWKSHNWNWMFFEENEDEWLFEELTMGEELFNEGNAMGHCVSSYASRCAPGYSAIVSVKFNNKRRLTAELNPSTKRIVQLRGKYNREADADENRVVAEWFRTIVNVSD